MRGLLIAVLSLTALHAALLCGAVCRAGHEASAPDGLRVDHYITDAPQHRRWAVMVDCAHPDRPRTLQAVPWLSDTQQAAPEKAHGETRKTPPLVPAGMKVRLWHIADGAHIELSGTALEAGAAGETIHVRTGHQGTVLTGRVRAAGSVELLASGKWQSQWPGGWRGMEKGQ